MCFGLLRIVCWLSNDVLGQPVSSFFKGQVSNKKKKKEGRVAKVQYALGKGVRGQNVSRECADGQHGSGVADCALETSAAVQNRPLLQVPQLVDKKEGNQRIKQERRKEKKIKKEKRKKKKGNTWSESEETDSGREQEIREGTKKEYKRIKERA
jgi:hypothetical protein